ncbi:DMT family transporter [Halocynthiibacter namhaensis]|uniref:DMT family transporter n=1 Tax=Halocynthiibacter namhaensis TaxID=1290553 RepID=UPI0005794C2C|nr:DMT family transporter [Halocynthiibacter namhaensis]
MPQTAPRISPQLASVLFMLLASALLAGTSILAKTLGQGIVAADGNGLHVFQISFGRFAFAFLAIAITVTVLRPKFGPLEIPLHIARTTAGWSGITLAFTALIWIPLPDAQAINFLNPVFAMIFAIPLLGERVGPWRWLAAAIAFLGALILLRPSGASFQPAALFALASAVITGFEVILIKRLSGRQNPLQILFTNNGIGLCIATAAALFVWTAPEPAEWGVMAALGITMICAQACFIQSMRRAEASFVISVSLSSLPFATLLDYMVFDAVPDRVSLFGAAIILSGVLLLFFREMRAKTP